jgi:hypothetical protein
MVELFQKPHPHAPQVMGVRAEMGGNCVSQVRSKTWENRTTPLLPVTEGTYPAKLEPQTLKLHPLRGVEMAEWAWDSDVG